MSDHVIIVGCRRGREIVPTSEMNQMVGRIGRRHDGHTYKADIILKEEDSKFEDAFKEPDSSPPAVSVMSCAEKSVFHILPHILSGRIKTACGIQEWTKRTLSFFQGNPPDPEEILKVLLSSGAACQENGEIKATRIGSVSSRLYLDPFDLSLLKKNLSRCGWNAQDACLAWALGNLKSVTARGYPCGGKDFLSAFRDDLPSGYECRPGCLLPSALWWCILGNASAGKDMALSVASLKKRWHSLKAGLLLTGEDASEVASLDIRITRGVGRHLVPFFSSKEMTKSRAQALFEMGYSSPEGTEGVDIAEWEG